MLCVDVVRVALLRAHRCAVVRRGVSTPVALALFHDARGDARDGGAHVGVGVGLEGLCRLGQRVVQAEQVVVDVCVCIGRVVEQCEHAVQVTRDLEPEITHSVARKPHHGRAAHQQERLLGKLVHRAQHCVATRHARRVRHGARLGCAVVQQRVEQSLLHVHLVRQVHPVHQLHVRLARLLAHQVRTVRVQHPQQRQHVPDHLLLVCRVVVHFAERWCGCRGL